jgi:hypothetical protein
VRYTRNGGFAVPPGEGSKAISVTGTRIPPSSTYARPWDFSDCVTGGTAADKGPFGAVLFPVRAAVYWEFVVLKGLAHFLRRHYPDRFDGRKLHQPDLSPCKGTRVVVDEDTTGAGQLGPS